ncbi:hypothetical protein [Comamonas testosteroni]|uniref:hypothetical protein n=1 Tax=Comamonas testosteroni TaxID=285 RepID=UPI0026EA0F18|nr:hypothetical protein [Comamonas testosteroni]
MIVKIFNQGTSNGKAHIDYLLSHEKHQGFKPQVIKGNAFITEQITGSITNKNKYTAGVIAFRDNEILEKSQLLDIIDSFEATVAPFSDKSRVNFLWVLHKDKNNTELHFITPRKDLLSNKALDIHPNTKANLLLFEHFTRATNFKYGFKQVDNKEYKKGNFDFSKKLVRDLVEKRAIFFQSKYCEKKKTIYNKNKRANNGMDRRTRTKNIANAEQHDFHVFNNKGHSSPTRTTPKPDRTDNINSQSKGWQQIPTGRSTAEELQSSQKLNIKHKAKNVATNDTRSSTQKANDLISSPLITQIQEVQALYDKEHDIFKRLDLYNRLLQLRYQLEIEENAKKLQEEKSNKIKFK